LFSFDYYIQKRLLNASVVTNDLYQENGMYLGYYSKLRRMNKGKDEIAERITSLTQDIMNHESTYKTNLNQFQTSVEKLAILQQDVKAFTKGWSL
jgi:hypothetical protein